MPVAEGRELIPLSEAAARFGVHPKTIRYWMDAKDLTRYQRGDRRVLVDVEELQQLIERKKEIRRVD